MLKIKLIILLLCLLPLLGVCKSPPSGASSSEAQAAYQAALGKLEGQVGAPQDAPSAPSQQKPSAGQNASSSAKQAAVNNSKVKPAWVDSVDSVFDRARYVAASGYASSRDMAEKNAFANLTAIFGQSINADQTITNTYQEAVRSGVTAGWTDNIAMRNTINTSSSMDVLIGAEIKEVWYDSKSSYYAVAVMEKERTAQLYNEMIKANQNVINNLIRLTQAEKNSLEGYSRYQFAAIVADVNITYGNILQVIGSPVPEGLEKGDNYRIEARNITKAIPVGINVKNDKSGRIQGAFAKVFSEIGFRSGGVNSRYNLNVDITVSPVDFPNNANKFVRMELGANFTDTGDKSVLLPYNFIDREGHTTLAEAENRVYTAAEREINDEYKDLLLDYLSHLVPKR